MGSAWTRRTTILLALLVLGAVAVLPWTVHDVFVPELDAALYVRTSLALLRGEGYAYLGVPFELRPPGFSVLLAPVLALKGTDFRAISAYVSLWGVLAVALFFVWLRPRLGDLPAFALAASLWVNPQFQQLCNMPMSDVPGVTLLLAAMLAEEWARRGGGVRREAAAGAVIAAATYVRSLSVLLLPAILLSRVSAGRPGAAGLSRMAVLCAVCAGLLVPWSVRNHRYEPETPADQTWLYSQWVAMWHSDRGDPASPLLSRDELKDRVVDQFRWMTSAVGNRLRSTPPAPRHMAFGLVGAFALGGVAWRRRRTGELFALGTSAVLLLWHASPDRLLVPLLLFVPPAVVELVLPLLARAVPRSIVVIAVSGMVIALGALDSRYGADWAALQQEDREQRELAARIAEHLEEGDVLATTLRAWRDAVYLDRPVYNLRPVLRRDGPEEAAALLGKYGVNVVVLRSGTVAGFREYVETHFTCTMLEPGLSVCRRPRASGGAPRPVPPVE